MTSTKLEALQKQKSPAYLKKLRRKATRQAKMQGIVCPDLLQAQKNAESKFRTLTVLNVTIDNGSLSEKVGARKAKKKMQDRWEQRDKGTTSTDGYYYQDQGLFRSKKGTKDTDYSRNSATTHSLKGNSK